MSNVFRSTDRLELSGEGNLVEGERILGRVAYRIVRRKKPSGLYSAEGTVSTVAGSSVDLFDLLNRNAQVILTFSGGTWECFLQSHTLGSGSARLVNRGRLHLDDEDP